MGARRSGGVYCILLCWVVLVGLTRLNHTYVHITGEPLDKKNELTNPTFWTGVWQAHPPKFHDRSRVRLWFKK